jgi:hypothetical protein
LSYAVLLLRYHAFPSFDLLHLFCYRFFRKLCPPGYDKDKVDEMTLALLYLVATKDTHGSRVWKDFDWATMDRLHEKGFIGDPKSKAKSVALTPEGERRSEELFRRLFGRR